MHCAGAAVALQTQGLHGQETPARVPSNICEWDGWIQPAGVLLFISLLGDCCTSYKRTQLFLSDWSRSACHAAETYRRQISQRAISVSHTTFVGAAVHSLCKSTQVFTGWSVPAQGCAHAQISLNLAVHAILGLLLAAEPCGL